MNKFCHILGSLALALTAAAEVQFDPDRTILFASFDRNANADFYRDGNKTAARADGHLVPGRNGTAIRLADGEEVKYTDVSLPAAAGLVEFDFKPEWNGNDNATHIIFRLLAGKDNYIEINKLGGTHGNVLGGAFLARTDGEIQARYCAIADADGQRFDISDWRAGQWHRLTLSWSGGQFQFQVDGTPVAAGTLTALPDLQAATLLLGRVDGAASYDNLRIGQPVPTGFVYLSDLAENVSKTPPQLKFGKDCFPTSWGNRLPLKRQGKFYRKGLALHAPGMVEYALNGEYARLVATIGINELAGPAGSVVFVVNGDGRELFRSRELLRVNDDWLDLDLDVSGVQTLRLETLSGDEMTSDHAVFLDAALLKPSVDRPTSTAGDTSPIKLEPLPADGKMKVWIDEVNDFVEVDVRTAGAEAAYRYTASPIPGQMALAPGNWQTAFNPVTPLEFSDSFGCELFASPGEYELGKFYLAAGGNLDKLQFSLETLTAEDGTRLPDAAVELFYGYRMPEARRYSYPAADSMVTTRYLLPLRELSLPAGEFREIFLRVHLPDTQPPGRYTGNLHIAGNGIQTTLPIQLDVLPIRLQSPPDKNWGIYYDPGRVIMNETALARELADLAAHHITMLYCGDYLRMRISRNQAGELQTSSAALRRGLEALRRNHFRGKVIVNHGLGEAISLFHPCATVEDKKAAAELVRHDAAYQALARRVMTELKQIAAEYPELELLVSTLDEVFNDGRLPLYLAATEAAKQVDGFQYYITFNFLDGTDAMRRAVAPYADYRSGHMYTWEWFLARGNTFAAYQQELDRYGSKAGADYNPVGYFYSPSWYRAVMGVEFWQSNLSFQIPWMYYSCTGSPYEFPESKGSHIFGFYDENYGQVIPTLIWEGYREGMDDYRYIYTLEKTIEKQRGGKPELAAEAAEFLQQFRASLPVPQGLEYGNQLIGTNRECPWTSRVAGQLKYSDFQQFRRQCAEYIIRLEQ